MVIWMEKIGVIFTVSISRACFKLPPFLVYASGARNFSYVKRYIRSTFMLWYILKASLHIGDIVRDSEIKVVGRTS